MTKLPGLILQFIPSLVLSHRTDCIVWKFSTSCVMGLDHLPKFSKLAYRKAVLDVAGWRDNGVNPCGRRG